MSKLPPWIVFLGTLLLLVVVCLWDYYPPLNGPQRFDVTFGKIFPGESDPLIVTGKPNNADFLAVRYLDAHTIAFVYDSWGQGGPTSVAIPITPGRRYALEIVFPALAAPPANPDAPPENLRVVLDDRVVFDTKVSFRQRGAQRAFFGRNPVGGTTCGPAFRGQLLRADDARPFVGSVRELLSRSDRFRGWLWSGRWQLVAITLLSAAAAWIYRRLSVSPSLLLSSLRLPSLRSHRVFLLTTALCAVAFAAVMTNGRFHLRYEESFGNFYDYQARSLLQGRLDVPEESLSGEAFVYGGKIYGYFGPTPALLRLPLVIFGLAFGELSRIAMLIYYVATLLGAYLLLRHAVRLLRPATPEPGPLETLLFTAHVGLGTTIFFLGSRAYIYHEAILCGILFAVWSCWCSLRFLSAPSSRWWLAALVLGTLSVHARPPAGLFALTVLGCVAAAQLFQVWLSASIEHRKSKIINSLAIGALAVAGVASFNALSYAKFRTIEGCPLRLNVQYHAKRLAHIDSKQFHFSNLRYGLDTYFLRPRVELTTKFPWLYQPDRLDPNTYPGAKLDLPDRTLAFPVGTTGLFVLSTLGCAWLVWRYTTARLPILILWASLVPLTVAMCAAIATAERYTGDFVPFFICAGAFGLVALQRRPAFVALFAAATLWSCALTSAAALHYQGKLVWGVEDDVPARYERLRQRIDRFFGVPHDHPTPNER